LGGWRAKFVCAIQPRFVFMDAAKMASVIASELHVVCMNVVSFVHLNAIGVCLSSSFNDVVIIGINAIGSRPAARQRAQCNQLQQEKHSGSTAPRFAYRGLYLADPTDKSVRATPLARSRPWAKNLGSAVPAIGYRLSAIDWRWALGSEDVVRQLVHPHPRPHTHGHNHEVRWSF
jgi:hypothetical protein